MAKDLSEMTLEELWQLFPIVLTGHRDCWAQWYADEAALLKRMLPEHLVMRISHAGSTAVRGIWAKPIIDIFVEIRHGCNMEEFAAPLTECGYRCMSREDDRMDFNKGYTGQGFAEKVYHLHLRREGDNRELYFRDYLNAHPDIAKEYEALKLGLWKQFEHNRDGYTEAKGDFINEYTERALRLYPGRYARGLTHVFFIRHAKPNLSNHDDRSRELSRKGLADRRLVTDYLARQFIDAVISSPYRRAADTVAQFAQCYGHRIRYMEGFRERRVDSVWIEDFNTFARRQWADFDYRLSDGECLREVQRRNIAALNEVLGAYEGRRVAIGTHGTALSTIIRHYNPEFGYEDFERIRPLMPLAVHFTFDGMQCLRIEQYNLFDGRKTLLWEADRP